MNKIVLLLALLAFAVTSFGQHLRDTTISREYYLQKSKRQKATGWLLLAGGTTLTVAGLIIGNQEEDPADFGLGRHFTTGLSLFVPGVIADLASIPFFISSAHHARKAATISVGTQALQWPQHHRLVAKRGGVVTIKVDL